MKCPVCREKWYRHSWCDRCKAVKKGSPMNCLMDTTWTQRHHDSLAKMLKLERKLDRKRDVPLIERIKEGLKYLAKRKARLRAHRHVKFWNTVPRGPGEAS